VDFKVRTRVKESKTMAKEARESKGNNTTSNPEIPEMKVAVGEGMRRLPVYLLLDASGSTAGAPIEAV